MENAEEIIENAKLKIDDVDVFMTAMEYFGDQTRCWENKTDLVELGAGKLIVNGMNHHKFNEVVQHYGCRAVWNLALNDDNKVKLMEKGVGEAVVAALNNHKQHADVQWWGCSAILVLCYNYSCLAYLMLLDIQSIFYAVQKNHPDIHFRYREYYSKAPGVKQEFDNLVSAFESYHPNGSDSRKQFDVEVREKIEMIKQMDLIDNPAKVSELRGEFKKEMEYVIEIAPRLLESTSPSIDSLEIEVKMEKLKMELEGNPMQPGSIGLLKMIDDINAKVDDCKKKMKELHELEERIASIENREEMKKLGKDRDEKRRILLGVIDGIELVRDKAKRMLSIDEWKELADLEQNFNLLESIVVQGRVQGTSQASSTEISPLPVERDGLLKVYDLINSIKNDCFEFQRKTSAKIAEVHEVMMKRKEGILRARDSLISNWKRVEEWLEKAPAMISSSFPELDEERSKHEKRKEIRPIPKILDEVESVELDINKLKGEQIKTRRSTSKSQLEILTKKINESERKLATLKSELDDMLLIFDDANVRKWFPDLIPDLIPDLVPDSMMDRVHDDGGTQLLSSKRRKELIQIPRTLRFKPRLYEVDGSIGSGGFSRVLKLKSIKDDKNVVAFKKYDVHTVTDDEARMISKEIEMLSTLKHENIVAIVGAIGDPDAADFRQKHMGIGIAMENCENGSMRDVLDRCIKNYQPLDIEMIYRLLLDVAKGLEYLHGKFIIHGDMKSDNVVVDGFYTAKICDFGLSKIVETTNRSSSRMGGGTTVYKPPELFKGDRGMYNDVYAYGCIILEMLTNHRPWNGLDVGEIVNNVLYEKQPHNISKARKDSKKELLNLMHRCLDYEKDKRPTISVVRIEMEKIAPIWKRIPLDASSSEYRDVENRFFPGGSDEGSLNRQSYRILTIDKIENTLAEMRYRTELDATKSMMTRPGTSSSANASASSDGSIDANERLLFHGTKMTNPSIILNHPDAMMKDYSNVGFYGKGLYFAEKARYSHSGYRYSIPGTNRYQMLVCSVICGFSKEYKTDQKTDFSQKDLRSEFHSVHGGPHGGDPDKSCMFVIYKDNQVAPRYLITYEPV